MCFAICTAHKRCMHGICICLEAIANFRCFRCFMCTSSNQNYYLSYGKGHLVIAIFGSRPGPVPSWPAVSVTYVQTWHTVRNAWRHLDICHPISLCEFLGWRWCDNCKGSFSGLFFGQCDLLHTLEYRSAEVEWYRWVLKMLWSIGQMWAELFRLLASMMSQN